MRVFVAVLPSSAAPPCDMLCKYLTTLTGRRQVLAEFTVCYQTKEVNKNKNKTKKVSISEESRKIQIEYKQEKIRKSR